MGSIIHIYDPENWKVILSGKSRLLPNDYIYKMEMGYCDDEISEGEISEFISKENYEKTLEGVYTVKKFPYGEQKIMLFDKDNNIVPLIKEIEYNNVGKQKKLFRKGKKNNR